MITISHPGPYTSRRLKNDTECPSVKMVEGDKKGMKMIENPRGGFLE